MLDRLDDVKWAEVQNGWGADTGRQIRALASADPAVRAAAIAKLHTTIYHQCSVFVISAKAVPFLVELLQSPAVQDKHRILSLLTDMAANEPHGHLANPGDFVDVAGLVTHEESGKSEPTDPADPFEWTTAAVRDGSEAYAALLADEDPRVRAAASFLLGFVGHPASEIAAKLRAQLDTETEPRAKASELIALAMLGIGPSSKAKPDVPRFEAILRSSEPPLVRLAAAIGLAYLLRNDLPEEARRMLEEGKHMPREDADAFPWHEGDVGQYAAQVMERLETEG